ncbi:hypothetical protein [Streptomyces gossypiisoli]|uniref:hypothetical protein n=1 Tax=Streptomyces gossypiisoli TaxID=2748864 RepID=UPI0038CDBE73
MGFAPRPVSWGHGYGVETGRLLLALGFEEHVRKGGAWRDSVVHAILDREWTARRA